MTPQAATGTQAVKTSSLTRPSDAQQAFDRMQQINDSIARRAFEIFEGNGGWSGSAISDWLQAESELLHPVHLEIAETDEALNVRAEVPGFVPKDLDVQVDGRRLTISGKHESREETTKGTTIYSEHCAEEVYRSIELPTEVDVSKVSATLKDGVLSIELPKAQQAKSDRAETKSAN